MFVEMRIARLRHEPSIGVARSGRERSALAGSGALFVSARRRIPRPATNDGLRKPTTDAQWALAARCPKGQRGEVESGENRHRRDGLNLRSSAHRCQATRVARETEMDRKGRTSAPGIAQDVGSGSSVDGPPGLGFVTRVVLTAFVFTGGRGTGIAIAAASGGSSSSGAA